MNMLQRNPRDSKHKEFHDGEYEYWPAKAPISGKSISIPTAVLNGLGMLAAVAAAALLTAALTVLYTLSSPLTISENHAIINVNIYNNVDDLDIRYTLIRELDPDTILKQEALAHSTQTLTLQDLTPGTKYILLYDSFRNGEWESIGDFPFITPGDAAEASDPTEISESEPEDTVQTEPVTEATEAVTEPEETTEEIAEETTPPAVWYPPVADPAPKPTKPTTDSSTEPPTEPTTEPTEEPTEEPDEPVEPSTMEPDISDVVFRAPEESGDENDGYYSFRQIHSFRDIPEGSYEVRILQNDVIITDYMASIDADGILNIAFTGIQIPIGGTSTTTVTVLWEDGSQTVSTHALVTPSMEEVSLDVTKNADNTHTFIITVTAEPSSEYTLAFETMLYRTYDDYTGASVEMVETAKGVYTGTHTTAITSTEEEEEAVVYVSAIWDMAGTPMMEFAPQFGYAFIYYEP